MEAVNLLPADLRQTKKKGKVGAVSGALPGKRTLQFGGALAALLALLVAAGYIHERSVVHHKKAVLAETQGRAIALQARVNAVKTAQSDAAARLAVVQSVSSSRMDWDRAMNDLARVLPPDVYLTTLSSGAPTPAASVGVVAPTTDTSTTLPTSGATLSISGVAPSHVGVAKVLDRLALVPWLSNILLASSTRATDGTATFSITATVNQVH